MARSSDSFFLLALLKDKTFQASEIRRVIALAGLYLVVTTLLLAVFYTSMLDRLVEGTAPLFFVSEDMQRFNEIVPGVSSVLGRWIINMMIINVIITSLIGLYISRKLGQPILAIKRALNEIGDGNLNVRLRESDNAEFADIVHALNNATSEIRLQIQSAQREFDTLQTVQEQPDASEQDVRSAIGNCKVALEYFNTQDPAPALNAAHNA